MSDTVDPAVQLGLLPISFQVACRTAGTTTRRRHDLTIHADWSVDTGHNIADERVAAALGGRVSCLDLIDYSIPAARYWLNAQIRVGPPVITLGFGGRWSAVDADDCCPRLGFTTPQKAAEHARSTRHISLVHGGLVRQLNALARHWQPLLEARPEPPRSHRLKRLWDCGLPPDRVVHVEQRLSDGEPLPFDLHLAIMAHQPNIDWLVTAMNLTGRDPRVTSWLVSESHRWEDLAMTERIAWLAEPLAPRLALELARVHARRADVRRLAESHNVTVATAAAQFLTWLNAAYGTTVDDLIGLAGSTWGLPLAPSADALVRARRYFGIPERHSDREVALALARHGSGAAAAAALGGVPDREVGAQ